VIGVTDNFKSGHMGCALRELSERLEGTVRAALHFLLSTYPPENYL
jgi:hypothetical protein